MKYYFVNMKLEQVSDAQELEEATALQPEESMKAKSTSSTRSNKKKSRHDLKRDEAVDPLTPITEFEEGEETKLMSPNGKTSRTSNEYVKSYISLIRFQKKPKTEVRENRILCKYCSHLQPQLISTTTGHMLDLPEFDLGELCSSVYSKPRRILPKSTRNFCDELRRVTK